MRRLGPDAGRRHEIQRVADTVGHVAVFLGLGRRGESQRPGMHLVHVGIAAGRECAQQVQAGRRLQIGLQHPVGIGNPRLGREIEPVDDIALVGRQFHASDDLHRGGPGFGELARHAAHLDHRHLGAERQDHGHLQHDLERVADIVGAEFGERLGAIAPLQQERLTLRDLGQMGLQPPRLARKDQGRIAGQFPHHGCQFGGIVIVGHLHPGQLAPVSLLPVGHGGTPLAGRVIGARAAKAEISLGSRPLPARSGSATSPVRPSHRPPEWHPIS
jgi:hypothetical protein